MYEVSKVIDHIDYELLREQKAQLLAEDPSPEAIGGIIALIDNLQDAVVADGLRSEVKVFGK